VLVDDPEHHRQTQASATLTLGGEKRLEHACLHRRAHADTRIGDFDNALPVLGDHPQADHAAVGQRIDRIEDEIGHQLAQLGWGTLDGWVIVRFDVETNRPTFGLSSIAPARRGRCPDRCARHGDRSSAGV